jgi:alpha-tubulin suppressor-like RCC1 family protein
MWGEFYRTDVPMPTDLTDIVQIALSYTLAIAVRRDGSVVVWGNNQHEQCVIPESAHDICEVSIARQHVLARRHDGTVITWGKHRNHPLTEVPAQVQGATQVCAQIACSAALTPDGRVVVWGTNALNHPVLATLPTVTQIAAGVGSLAVLTADQQVIVWGEIWRDQRVPYVMSLDDDERNQAPIMCCVVPADAGQVLHMAFGLMSTDGVLRNGDLIVTAVTDTGCVLVWGLESDVPGLPPYIPAESRLSVGMSGAAATQTEGGVPLWLTNLAPDIFNDVMHIAMDADSLYLVAVHRNGTVAMYNPHDIDEPRVVLDAFTKVSATAVNALGGVIGLRRDGSVVVHQGDADPATMAVPVAAHDIVQVLTVWNTYMALRRDGRVVVWGSSQLGWCDVPADAIDVSQLVGQVHGHMVVVCRDGRVVSWGGQRVTDVARMIQQGLIVRIG